MSILFKPPYSLVLGSLDAIVFEIRNSLQLNNI